MGPVIWSTAFFRYGLGSMLKGKPGVTVAAGTLAVGLAVLDVVVVSALLALILVLAGAMTTVNVVLYVRSPEPGSPAVRVTLNIPSGVPSGAVPVRI